jgi:hypothetical protein
MKTPLLTAHLPTCASFTAEALAKSLQGFDWKISAAILEGLKEASVRDQNFEQAQTFRAAGAALQKSAIGNHQSSISSRRKGAKPA